MMSREPSQFLVVPGAPGTLLSIKKETQRLEWKKQEKWGFPGST